MLDVKTGRTVRLYQCDKCGERLWEDQAGERKITELMVSLAEKAQISEAYRARK